MGQEGARGRLMTALSDGDSLTSAVITHAAEQELQGVQNNGLIQLCNWRLIERGVRVGVAISRIRSVAVHLGFIVEPVDCSSHHARPRGHRRAV